jgi:hypothetical protein
MGAPVERLEPSRRERLAQLMLVPSLGPPVTPRERVEAALGREFAGFLIDALSRQVGPGSSSP